MGSINCLIQPPMTLWLSPIPVWFRLNFPIQKSWISSFDTGMPSPTLMQGQAHVNSLSPGLEKIRQQIIEQNQSKKNRLSKILNLETTVEDFMLESAIPARIPVPVKNAGRVPFNPVNQMSFMFDTLPVVKRGTI